MKAIFLRCHNNRVGCEGHVHWWPDWASVGTNGPCPLHSASRWGSSMTLTRSYVDFSGSSPNSKTKGQTPHDRFASSSVAIPLEDLTWTTRPLMADNGTKLRADPLPKFRWIRSGTGVPPKPCWGKGETIGNQHPIHYSSRPPGHQALTLVSSRLLWPSGTSGCSAAYAHEDGTRPSIEQRPAGNREP